MGRKERQEAERILRERVEITHLAGQVAAAEHIRKIQDSEEGDRPHSERTIRDEANLKVFLGLGAEIRSQIKASAPGTTINILQEDARLSDPDFWRELLGIPELRTMIEQALKEQPRLIEADESGG